MENEYHPYKYLVSRSGEDAQIALKIRDILRDAGLTAITQEDFPTGSNFIDRMDRSLSEEWRVVAVCSESYFQSEYCRSEWQQPLSKDPNNLSRRLIPLNVAAEQPPGILSLFKYVPIHEFLENKERLTEAVLISIGFLQESQCANVEDYWAKVEQQFLTNVSFGTLSPMYGRDRELAAIEAALNEESLCVITGMGGIGKTTLTRTFARAYANQFEVVWWVNAETESGIVKDLAQLAKRLRGIGQAETDLMAAESIIQTASSKTEKKWLIIYDNVSNPLEIEKWLPRDNCNTVITSRYSVWPTQSVTKIDLKVLDRQDSVALLTSRAPQGDAHFADRIAETLGDLPLALGHATGYLAENPATTFEDYLQEINELIYVAPDLADYPIAVAQTIELSLEKIEESSPDAGALLALASFWPPEKAELVLMQQPAELHPFDLANILSSRRRLSEILGRLARFSLIRIDESFSISAHRIVLSVARKRYKGDVLGLARYAVLAFLTRYDHGNYNDVNEMVAPLTYTVDAVRDTGLEFDPIPENPFNMCVALLVGSGSLNAVEFYCNALRIAEGFLEEKSPTLAQIRRYAGRALAKKQRFEEAETVWSAYFSAGVLSTDEASKNFDHYEYGRALARTGEDELAMQHLTTAFEYGWQNEKEGCFPELPYERGERNHNLVLNCASEMANLGESSYYEERLSTHFVSRIDAVDGKLKYLCEAYLGRFPNGTPSYAAALNNIATIIENGLSAEESADDPIELIDLLVQHELSEIVCKQIPDLRSMLEQYAHKAKSGAELDGIVRVYTQLYPTDSIQDVCSNLLLGWVQEFASGHKVEIEKQDTNATKLLDELACFVAYSEKEIGLTGFRTYMEFCNHDIWAHQYILVQIYNNRARDRAAILAREWLSLPENASLTGRYHSEVFDAENDLLTLMAYFYVLNRYNDVVTIADSSEKASIDLLATQLLAKALFASQDYIAAIPRLMEVVRADHEDADHFNLLLSALYLEGFFDQVQKLIDVSSNIQPLATALGDLTTYYRARSDTPSQALSHFLSLEKTAFDDSDFVTEGAWAAIRANDLSVLSDFCSMMDLSNENDLWQRLIIIAMRVMQNASEKEYLEQEVQHAINDLATAARKCLEEGVYYADILFLCGVIKNDRGMSLQAIDMCIDREWNGELRWIINATEPVLQLINPEWVETHLQSARDFLSKNIDLVDFELDIQPKETSPNKINKSVGKLKSTLPDPNVAITCGLKTIEGFEQEINRLRELLALRAGRVRTGLIASLADSGYILCVTNFRFREEDDHDFKLLVNLRLVIESGYLERFLIEQRVEMLFVCDAALRDQLNQMMPPIDKLVWQSVPDVLEYLD